MSTRDMSLFASLHMFNWIRFVPLNPRLVNTLVRNVSPGIIRGNLDVSL